jgi:CheY-like chemotaxis protein
LRWQPPRSVAAVEVPALMTSRERRGQLGKGKTDPVDALAIARITARELRLPPVRLSVGPAADLRASLSLQSTGLPIQSGLALYRGRWDTCHDQVHEYRPDHRRRRGVSRPGQGTARSGPGFAVVGEAKDGSSGLEAARLLRPDYLLLDLGLPDVDGFEVAGALAADEEPPIVVLTSGRDASDFGPRLTNSRAVGFIPKEELSGSAIRTLGEA